MEAQLYTEEESALLNKTKNIRIRIVDHMVKDGPPERVGDIRVLNEMLSSLESSTHTAVSNRLKHKDTGNTEAMLDLVAETLKQAGNQPVNKRVSKVTIPDNIIDVDLVPGETDINPTSLDISEFTSQHNKG